MRYFTRGWANGELSDEEEDSTPKAYWKHIEGLLPTVPAAVARLAKTNLHDGLIARVRLDRRRKTLVLVLIVRNDGDRSCSEITLNYAGVAMSDRYVETLTARARDRESCVLYDEIDSEPDGSYVHRFLFWPEGEISVWFRKFSLKKAKRPDARLQLAPYFVVEE
jgi:hypothetical protein